MTMSSRIPESLKAVFLESARGNHETVAVPYDKTASRSFASPGGLSCGILKLLSKQKQPREKGNVSNIEPPTIHLDLTDARPMPFKQSSWGEISLTKIIPENTPSHSLSGPKKPPIRLSPQEYLDGLMRSRGYSLDRIKTLETVFHNEPTALQKASYHPHMCRLVKTNNIKALKMIFSAGISGNPCNAFGESLLHLVCRLGNESMLQTMIDCGTELRVCDDYGRTPLHDACWTSGSPAFATADMIMQKTIGGGSYLFQMVDSRGSTPLCYIRKEQWEIWIQFLLSKKDRYWPKIKNSNVPPVTILGMAKSRPIHDPKNALSVDLARMVSSGKLSPSDALILQGGSETEERSLTSDDDDEASLSDSSDTSESSSVELQEIIKSVHSIRRRSNRSNYR